MRYQARSTRAALLILLFSAVPAFAASFVADLDPASYDNSTRAAVQGEGQVTGTLTGSTLTLSGHFSGLSSSATRARLGQVPVLGMPASSFFADLTITSGASGTISGTITLTPDQAASLNNKALFIRIDAVTTTPDGSLWGWFLPVTTRSAR